jgi:hypothetical protein
MIGLKSVQELRITEHTDLNVFNCIKSKYTEGETAEATLSNK